MVRCVMLEPAPKARTALALRALRKKKLETEKLDRGGEQEKPVLAERN
jgi:hypothetical protein